mmetsp:Transcript_78115/g.216001  ORF Transcript_78115/g.216001 Transcript_78115/m.216001 type:complete len:382 (+) Transcript_78115:69-1214(+)
MGCEPSKTSALSFPIKKEFEDWWAAHKDNLFTRITDRDFIEHEYDEHFAKCVLQFVDHSLPGLLWMAREDAPKDRTKETYMADYAKKLGDRTDVAHDNLWNIRERALKCIEDGIETAKDNPTLQALLKALHQNADMLNWSQGSFGPKVYNAKFLTTYANTMLSDRVWTQEKDTYGTAFVWERRPLECGIFYVDAGVNYPLHYHEELEGYFVLAGSTDFKWLYEGKVINMKRTQGEWHFNYPNLPHAITTPDGKPHLSLWLREGGLGQEANNRLGPKWIGSVDGMTTVDTDDQGNETAAQEQQDDPNMIGSAGYEPGAVFREDIDAFMRVLSPAEFKEIRDDPDGMNDIEQLLTPGRMGTFRKRDMWNKLGLKFNSPDPGQP